MKLKLSALTTLFLLLVSISALAGERFGPDVEVDTSTYFTIENYFLSPVQLRDYNFLGGGAKARGMGGAFFAVSDDPSAASWNPAGLSQLEKPQMDLSFSSYVQRVEYTSTLNASNLKYSFGDKLKYDNNSISFASVGIPFKIRGAELVGGVLYQKLADIYQENKYGMVLDSTITLPGYDTLGSYLLPSIGEQVTGSLNEVSISLGGKVYKTLALGVGVNIYGGNFTSDADFFNPSAGIGRVAYVDTTGLNGIRFRPHIKSNYSGANLTFGTMYKWDKLRLAGVVKTPFTLKEDIDAKLWADLIESGVVLEGSRFYSPSFKTDRKWKMPTMIGFGGSYQINALTLAADIEIRNYSKTEVTYRKNIANPTGEEVTTGSYLTDKWWGGVGNNPPFVPSLGWRNLTQVRIGAEYLLNTKYGKIPLRAGFRNDPKLFTTQLDSSEVYVRTDMSFSGNDTFYTPTFIQSKSGVEKGSWINGNVFSVGTGIAWSQIKLDITLELAKYGDVKEQITTGRKPFDLGNRKLFPSLERKTFNQEETNNNYSRIMISFTGFF